MTDNHPAMNLSREKRAWSTSGYLIFVAFIALLVLTTWRIIAFAGSNPEKAEIFGFVVMLIACNTGLRTRGGPREIGFAVTKSVVTSLIAILVLDYFITKALA